MRKIIGTGVVTVAVFALTAGLATANQGGVPAIPLNPEQETGAVDSDGSGFFSYTISGNELCYTLEVRELTDDPVAAHIHIGDRHVAGPVVIPLATPPAATSTVSACLTAAEGGDVSPAELAAIASDPRAFYTNVHTPLHPGGEVRGQLK